MPNNPYQYWIELLKAAQPETQAGEIDDAIFLFAAASIRAATTREDLEGIWKRYSNHWEERLPEPAAGLLQQFYKKHLKARKNTEGRVGIPR